MANITGHNAITINAPIEDVFEKFNDPKLQSEWYAQPYKLSNYDPPLQKGTTYAVKGKFMGQDTESKYEVVEYNPPKRVVVKITGSGTGFVAHSFEKVKDGTRVEFEFTRDFSGWLTSSTALEIHNILYKRIAADLESFKRFVES